MGSSQTARYSFWTVPQTGATGVNLRVTGKNYWAGPHGFGNLAAVDLVQQYPELVQPSDGYAATVWPELGSVLHPGSNLGVVGRFPGEN